MAFRFGFLITVPSPTHPFLDTPAELCYAFEGSSDGAFALFMISMIRELA
jgi:hypothetical protein